MRACIDCLYWGIIEEAIINIALEVLDKYDKMPNVDLKRFNVYLTLEMYEKIVDYIFAVSKSNI